MQFPLLWNVASAREWDFTAQEFWWCWIFAHLRGNIVDVAIQMDVHKTLCPFYTTKKMPRVTVTITKNASLAAVARYICITTICTVGNLQIFNLGHFFSSKHSVMNVERIKRFVNRVCYECCLLWTGLLWTGLLWTWSVLSGLLWMVCFERTPFKIKLYNCASLLQQMFWEKHACLFFL